MGRHAPSTSAFSSAPITATPSYTALPYHLTITTTSQRCIRPNITSTPTSSTSALLLDTSISIATNGFHAPIATPSPHQLTSPWLLLQRLLTTLRTPADFQVSDKN